MFQYLLFRNGPTRVILSLAFYLLSTHPTTYLLYTYVSMFGPERYAPLSPQEKALWAPQSLLTVLSYVSFLDPLEKCTISTLDYCLGILG